MESEMALVSCLMVTRNRRQFVKRATRAFQQQTYPNRELIVLDDGQDDTVSFVKGLNDTKIRYVRPEDDSLRLGELRNLAVQAANGEFIMQWDDDDWYHPNRIRVQLAALRYTDSQFCFLSRWMLFWPARGIFVYSKELCWEGSILGLRTGMPKYPPLARGEDSALVQQVLNSSARVCFVDHPDLYAYTVHGANTYGDDHFASNIFAVHSGKIEQEKVSAVMREIETSDSA